jgi:serine/threonine protein phosphatase PrpC
MYKSMMVSLVAGLSMMGEYVEASTPNLADEIGAYFEYKTVIIPKDVNKHRGGEDSADSNETLLVVADGVGGWINSGINPGLFSLELTKIAVSEYEKTGGKNTPVNYIDYACKTAAAKKTGTATITTLTLKSDHEIWGANLGDSGYSLFHVNDDDTLEMYFRSVTQQRMHNFPLQCGTNGDDP